MKNFISPSWASMLAIATMWSSCESNTQKLDNAQTKIEAAKTDLKLAEKEGSIVAQKVATEEEWKSYKAAEEAKVKDNEVQIMQLKKAIQANKTKIELAYLKNINQLELRNTAMKARIDQYDKNHSDWAVFKTEFGKDMDEIGKAMKNLIAEFK
jgi:hypothetical protein